MKTPTIGKSNYFTINFADRVTLGPVNPVVTGNRAMIPRPRKVVFPNNFYSSRAQTNYQRKREITNESVINSARSSVDSPLFSIN